MHADLVVYVSVEVIQPAGCPLSSLATPQAFPLWPAPLPYRRFSPRALSVCHPTPRHLTTPQPTPTNPTSLHPHPTLPRPTTHPTTTHPYTPHPPPTTPTTSYPTPPHPTTAHHTTPVQVRSRFAAEGRARKEDFTPFLSCLTTLGFMLKQQDADNTMFVVWRLAKAVSKAKGSSNIVWPALGACTYKKR